MRNFVGAARPHGMSRYPVNAGRENRMDMVVAILGEGKELDALQMAPSSSWRLSSFAYSPFDYVVAILLAQR